MGKRILPRRKGYGHLWARSPGHRHIGAVKYRPFKEGETQIKFKIIEFIHSPGRMTPVARIKYDDNAKGLFLPPEGIFEGDEFLQSKGGEQLIEVGNILPLKDVPLGTLVFNVEGKPQDGGKFARASGVAAAVNNKEGNRVQLLLRSKKTRWFNEKCLCTIGVVAGGDRTTKPFVKAGNKFYYVRSKAKKWPVVRGCAMNACSHPFGGGRHKHPHISTTTSRNAPPGRKVGLIAARRSGYRK
jgi:large subunit ribosomal protein L2